MPIRRIAVAIAVLALALGTSLVPAQASSAVPSGATAAVSAVPSDFVPVAVHYSNCSKLNKKYPHGVGKKGAKDHVSSGSPVTNFTRNNTVYAANKARDRDKDGIACEKH